jgi:hypothetical protein
VPVRFLHIDVVVLCGLADVGEGLVALFVAHALDLVEPGDRVADVTLVGHGLLALAGEREHLVRQI